MGTSWASPSAVLGPCVDASPPLTDHPAMAEKDISGPARVAAASGGADGSALLSVRQAIEIIDGTPVHPRIERLPLAASRGYRLARDLIADRDYPPFAKSMMDGFAVRSADLKDLKSPQINARRDWRTEKDPAPTVELKVVGEVAAGQMSQRAVGPGEAIAIMTGRRGLTPSCRSRTFWSGARIPGERGIGRPHRGIFVPRTPCNPLRQPGRPRTSSSHAHSSQAPQSRGRGATAPPVRLS